MAAPQALQHLARRGMEVYMAAPVHNKPEDGSLGPPHDGSEAPMSPAMFVPLVVAGVIFVAIYASMHYTLGSVVATLAMVEQPETAVVEFEAAPPAYEDLDSKGSMGSKDAGANDSDKLVQQEVMIVKQVPITNSIKRTIAHIRSIGGYRANWRGLSAGIMYDVARGLTFNLVMVPLSLIGSFSAARILASIISTVLLSRLHMTWTHVIISKPSPLPWYKRIPGDRKIFRALALPSLVFALAENATFTLPMLAALLVASPDVMANDGPVTACHLVLPGVVGAVTGLLLAVLILLPASVTLTRVEASFLPEDQETIVPFDRTLNGANTSAITFEDRASKKSLFIEAWRSFDMSSRLRLIKFYVKFELFQLLFLVAGAMVVLATMPMPLVVSMVSPGQ